MAVVFSIIIPVYNVEKYLGDCLNSLIRQTCTNWEAICVNDGSTDGSLSVLEGYASKEPRIRVVTKVNGGLSSARNAGLEKATGDYILFLDSDDWLEPDALEIITKNLNQQDLLCFSGRRFFESEGRFRPADRLTEQSFASGMDYYNENALLPRDFAFVCVVLRAYKRSYLLNSGLRFREGIFHEDNLFTPLACFYARKVTIIDKCLYDYRVRRESITTTVNPQRKKDMMGIANELASFFIPKQGFDKKTVYRAITHHYQVALLNDSKVDRGELHRLCDWRLYRKVSRTKLRHVYNYWTNLLIK